MELSFGEQIKILLNRKHMTIKDLAGSGYPVYRTAHVPTESDPATKTG